jgi:hypothetical protein
MMLIGRWFDEAMLYRSAAAFERETDQTQFAPAWWTKIKQDQKPGGSRGVG